jgi:hypothetical protein
VVLDLSLGKGDEREPLYCRAVNPGVQNPSSAEQTSPRATTRTIHSFMTLTRKHHNQACMTQRILVSPCALVR